MACTTQAQPKSDCQAFVYLSAFLLWDHVSVVPVALRASSMRFHCPAVFRSAPKLSTHRRGSSLGAKPVQGRCVDCDRDFTGEILFVAMMGRWQVGLADEAVAH